MLAAEEKPGKKPWKPTVDEKLDYPEYAKVAAKEDAANSPVLHHEHKREDKYGDVGCLACRQICRIRPCNPRNF
jgi:hypothetical protein